MTIKYQGHEFKGTPGEWVVHRNNSYYEVRAEDECGEYIRGVGDVCSGHPGNPESGIQEANARLFAASPKLLEALIAMVEQRSSTELAEASDQARSAILQALGATNDS